MPSPTKSIRNRVYATFAAEGRAPSLRELARLCALTAEQVADGLIELAERHQLVISADGDAVRMAHPFSAAPMGFVVRAADEPESRMWWGGCAWDSFGIGAALALAVQIDTTCPGCGTPHTILADPINPPDPALVVHFLVPAERWWADVVHTCSHIRVFCSTTHVDDWLARTDNARGEVVALADVWRLAQTWYGDRLAADYQPRPVVRSQELLAAVGLTGPFWQLPI